MKVSPWISNVIWSPTDELLSISICVCCACAVIPPVIAEGLTTIDPLSPSQRGSFTVWLAAQLLYAIGGKTVIVPPKVISGKHVNWLTVVIV